MSRLTYISRYGFIKKDDFYYTLPAYGDNFWLKYLDVFDKIDVIGEDISSYYLKADKYSKIHDKRISIKIIPKNTYIKEIIKNDKKVKRLLEGIVKDAEYLLIKPSSRKGLMAIRLAKKYNKPYMIEMTGDIRETLKYKGIIRRLYGYYLYYLIKKAIRNCQFGLYVTQEYLQKNYPIEGNMCGCSDVIIKDYDIDVLNKRIDNIKSIKDTDEIRIGLIGNYHGKIKGIDTAIKALSKINKNIKFLILGMGSHSDQLKWLNFGKKFGFTNIEFTEPIFDLDQLNKWIDSIDIMILPSRSEGLPRCIVEAMSRACPCITSNKCGLIELIDEKWCHKANDYKKLAILIEKAINNKNDLIDMAKNNFLKAKLYSYDVLKNKRNNFLLEFKNYVPNKSK